MISVIIPVRNREKVIERAIASVLAQRCREMLEVLVVDDASTDGTAERVQRLGDARVHLIRLAEPGGACRARNMGIEQARGEWIAFQDSDDEWLPGKLEEQLEALMATGADLCFTRMQRCDENGQALQLFPHEETRQGFVSYGQLLFENLASTQTWLGKRALFERFRFDERYRRLQDWELVLRAAKQAKLYYLKKPLVRVYACRESIGARPEWALQAHRMLLKDHRDAICRDDRVCRQWLAALIHDGRACRSSVFRDGISLLSRKHKQSTNAWIVLRCLYEEAAFRLQTHEKVKTLR